MIVALLIGASLLDVAHADSWDVKSVKFVNDCQKHVFVMGVGWVNAQQSLTIRPGKGIMPFYKDRIIASFEELYMAGLDRHMNVLEMNDGRIIDTGSSFRLNGGHPNLMGYMGWYSLDMEVTTWNETEDGPFCTSGHGGARTRLDFNQCVAHGGVVLNEGEGKVCAKYDGSHIFCGLDENLPLYKFLVQSTEHWDANQMWESDAAVSAPLSSFLCDPSHFPVQRGVGFLIDCNPHSRNMGKFQVRFCPASASPPSTSPTPPRPTTPPPRWSPCTSISKACCNPHTHSVQNCPSGVACKECGGGHACECPFSDIVDPKEIPWEVLGRAWGFHGEHPKHPAQADSSVMQV